MYCSLGQNQFFDDAGAPLSAGRVKIYAKGSDTLLPIYEDNGDGFVPAQNPVITANDGRIPTVFWPAALVDVVVEKSNGDGTYTELDSYVAGLDLASVEAVQGVGSITELRSIMPSDNMVVQVNGYYTAGDSPTRKYLWVAGAANADDGGYVIASLVDNGGRWVMLWEGERLPISLYGVMQGRSGQAMTGNLPSVMALGRYVEVGGVRVNVPDTIDFDGRIHGTSDLSPLAYYINSGSYTTIHYVSASQRIYLNTINEFSVVIHCAGFRGDAYFNAGWMFDQYLVNKYKDPFEKVSTKMFMGNVSSVHDAFMDCCACSKVYMVELSKDGTGTTLYDLLDSNDRFFKKIVIDHTQTSNPAYSASGCVWLDPYGFARLTSLYLSDLFFGERLQIFSVNNGLRIIGDSSVSTELVDLYLTNLYSSGNVLSSSLQLGSPSEYIVFAQKILNWAQFMSDVRLQNYVLNADAAPNPSVKAPLYNFAPTSGNTLSVDMTNATNFPTNDKFNIGDFVSIVNRGAGVVSVRYSSNAGAVAVLNHWEGCTFIKSDTSTWARMSPS